MGKKLFAVVIALVAAQVFSGCYLLRELSWDTDKVKPGDKTTATIGLQGSGSTMMARGATEQEGRFFLVVLAESSEGIAIKRPTFDSNDQLGAKEKLIRDDALLEFAFDQPPCDGLIPFRRQGTGPGGAWRTESTVPNTEKFIQAKLKAAVADDAPGGGIFGLVASGEWIDDGDDIPEDPGSSEDEITCTGFTTTSFGVKGPEAP